MYSLNIHGRLLTFDVPMVMAIINCTPDSFYQSCATLSEKEILSAAKSAIAAGATILDVGGYSTRPGAAEVTADEEWQRVATALNCIRRQFPEIPLSVDTFRAEVAKKAVEQYEADIINDISGGTLDAAMFQTVADLQVPYVLTHFRGTPQTMQQCAAYDCLLSEMIAFFQERIYKLKQLGVKDILLDPGFGFAKTLEHNYELLGKLSYLQVLNLPLLVGVSRKSMIYKLLGTNPQGALNGTTVANTLALTNGAVILRVHDVKEAVETIKIYQKVNENGFSNRI